MYRFEVTYPEKDGEVRAVIVTIETEPGQDPEILMEEFLTYSMDAYEYNWTVLP